MLPIFTRLVIHPYSAVRHLAARCLATFVELDSVFAMTIVIKDILPLLDAADCDMKRKGSIEAVACIVEKLQFDVVPYIVLLIIPLLGKISLRPRPHAADELPRFDCDMCGPIKKPLLWLNRF